MADYGYSHNNQGWKESRNWILARALEELIIEIEYSGVW